MASNMIKFSLAILLIIQLTVSAFKPGNQLTTWYAVCCVILEQLNLMEKRDVKQEWEDLGWAWGKRSDPQMVPRRFLRALHPIKKNPDWGDLGWTWGRK